MKIRFTSLLFLVAVLGLIGNITAQTIQTVPIAKLRGANAYEGGGADSNFVYCKIVGIIYGNNLGATGNRIQYTVRDATGGIGIFKNTNDLPFELAQGDSVRAIGLINNFNGLSQVSLDSVIRIGINGPIRAPRRVKILNEETESDLVVLKGCSLSVPTSWPASPSGSGFVAKFMRGTREFDIRIDNDCDLFNEPAPTGFVDIVGIGGQFDPSIPKNSGYQLFPRALTDITRGVAAVLDLDFEKKSIVVSENVGSIEIPISQAFSSTDTFRVEIIGADSNATKGLDYSIRQGGLVTFPANLDSSQSVTINIVNDNLVEGIEKFKLKLRKINGSSQYAVGSDSVFAITIIDDEAAADGLPIYTIGLLRGNNAFEGGVADSINVTCKINGTLYGPNLRGVNNGIQFVVRDATGGINIFSGTNNFGLTLQEGDSVRAIGKVSQFNGLSQLNLDSVVKLATGRTLKAATLVDSLSEATESDLVKISGYSLVDAAQWTTGMGSGFTVKVSNGNRTIDLRIDNDSPLWSQPAPAGNITSITGLGGQFDSSIPKNSGYQLIPRKVSDIEISTEVQGNMAYKSILAYPNPSNGNIRFQFNGFGEEEIQFAVFSHLGKQIAAGSASQKDLSGLISDQLQQASAGIYHCNFTVSNRLISKQIVKQ